MIRRRAVLGTAGLTALALFGAVLVWYVLAGRADGQTALRPLPRPTASASVSASASPKPVRTKKPPRVSKAFPTRQGNPDVRGKIQPFGNGRPSPVKPGFDGCNRNYADPAGKRTICVPVSLPRGEKITCAALRRLGIGAVRVVGADELRLGKGALAAVRGALVCGP